MSFIVGRLEMRPSDNETWLIDFGDEVIHKKATCGMESLSSLERLVYCIWVADYAMRNAGDLQPANDLYSRFKEDGLALAKGLHLEKTSTLLALPDKQLEEKYFGQFEAVCDEIRLLISGRPTSR